MINSGIISSRHRTEIEYFLNLSSVNADYLFIPQSEKTYQVPSTGNYEFGTRIKLPTKPTNQVGLIGYSVANFVADRWSFDISNNGGNFELRFLSDNFNPAMYYDVYNEYNAESNYVY